MDNEQNLEPEESQGDVDSALGDDRSSLTQSLRSSLLESVKENGREYHRYKSTAGNYYVFPEDEAEQERLDLQHEMFLFTFGRNLYNAPLEKDKLKEVLDLGTGTGIWAIDFADDFPNAQVIGTVRTSKSRNVLRLQLELAVGTYFDDTLINQYIQGSKSDPAAICANELQV